jgi:hypothetical protein
MTVLHVLLFPAVVRTTDPLLSFASHIALGELGTAAATCSTKTKTSSSKTPPDGQALLGPSPPVLGRLEKVAPGRHSRNCGALASCRISALLELDLEGEKTGRQKKTVEGNPESDLLGIALHWTSRLRSLRACCTPPARLAMLLQGRSPFSCDCTLSALITASLTPSVIGDRPSHPIRLQQLESCLSGQRS